MNIKPITPKFNQKQNNKNDNPNFTGAFDNFSSALRFLDTNQAWGANAVDLCSMVIPRTTVDFINRGPEAGTETARRESMGTFNHSMVGVYGTMAGMGLAYLFNKKFGIRADKIFANNQTVDILAKYWNEALDERVLRNLSKEEQVKIYTDKVADNIKLFNTDNDKKSGYIKLSQDAKEEFSKALSDKLINSESKTVEKDFAKYLHTLMVSDTGAETKVILEGFGIQADNSLKTLISNVYNVSKTFTQDTINDIFRKNNADNVFIKGLKNLNIKRSVAGLGIAALVGMSTQPINMYLTKKKTGNDGFVGVKGREKDKSSGFKLLKGMGFLAFATAAISTITTNPKKLLSKIQFQGMTPTINQLKLVYGLTIASRLLAARDKDELRESAVKDSLGFLNLLVLGSLVTKGVARLFDKTLINVTDKNANSFWKWLTNSSLKTRDEILYSSLKNRDIKTVKNGKALPFKELIKLADKETKGKLRILNIAQVAGYLYSGLVLGIGVPKLNIYMTNKSEAKRLAKLKAQEQAQNTQQDNDNKISENSYSQMIKSDNVKFLSKYGM